MTQPAEAIVGRSESPRRRSPNLAVLASTAAISLDRKSRGQNADLAPVRELASFLEETIRASTQAAAESKDREEATATGGVSGTYTSSHSALLSPLAADLLSRAFPADLDRGGWSLPQLSQETQEVIASLRSIADGSSNVDPNKLRDFCVALSRSAQAQLALAHSGRPEHPYQR